MVRDLIILSMWSRVRFLAYAYGENSVRKGESTFVPHRFPELRIIWQFTILFIYIEKIIYAHIVYTNFTLSFNINCVLCQVIVLHPLELYDMDKYLISIGCHCKTNLHWQIISIKLIYIYYFVYKKVKYLLYL
jgi:hypothetical protein